jgi:putative transposase
LRALGYTVKDACSTLGISRSAYYIQPSMRGEKVVPEMRELDLLERIKGIKTDHPFWGYRRVRAWLVHWDKIRVNEKRVRRIMRENGLMATQTVHKARRTHQRSKPKAERPRQYWGIDMTKFIIPVLGHNVCF